MTTVYVDSFESFDAAFRRFNKKVQEARILIEVKERQAYKKPSDARRAEKAAARSRAAKRKKKMDRVLEFQSMHKFPLRRRNPRPYHANNNVNNNHPNSHQNNNQRQGNYNHAKSNGHPDNRQNHKQSPTQPSSESLKSLQDKFNSK